MAVCRACERLWANHSSDLVAYSDCVPNGPNVGVVCALFVVNKDCSAFVNVQPGSNRKFRLWSHTNRHHHNVDIRACAIAEHHVYPAFSGLDGRCANAGDHVNAIGLEFEFNKPCKLWSQGRQHLRRKLDDRDVEATLPECLCGFEANKASAKDYG